MYRYKICHLSRAHSWQFPDIFLISSPRCLDVKNSKALVLNIKLPEHCTLHSLCFFFFFLINIQTSEKLPMESISDPGLQPVLMLPVRIQYYNLSKIVLLKVFKHIIEILILLFYLLIQTHYCSGVWFPLSLLFFFLLCSENCSLKFPNHLLFSEL